MLIHVRHIDGEMLDIVVDPDDTVGSMKMMVAEKMKMSSFYNKMVCGMTILEDNDRKVWEYGIKNTSVIRCVEILRLDLFM